MDGLGGYFWNAAKVFPDIAQNVKCALKDIVIPSDDEMPKYTSSQSCGVMKASQSKLPNVYTTETLGRTPKTVLKVPPFGKNRGISHHISPELNTSEPSKQDIALPFQKPKLSSTTMKQVESLIPNIQVPQKSLLKLNSSNGSKFGTIDVFEDINTLNDNPYTLTLEPSIHRLKASSQASFLDGSPTNLTQRKTYNQCKIHTKNMISSCCRTCDFLPLCEECIKAHDEHTIITISEGVGDVVEVFRECLSVVVDRHNVMESLLPEIRHFSAKSETMLKNVKRSVEKSTTCLMDAIKAREDSTNSEIRQLLSVGSDKLNSLHKDSIAYSKYILERLKTLEDLEKISGTNTGLALNTFIDLKPEYERLIYQCQDIPLLGQPLIQHWYINPGNIQNLLATEEIYITNSSRKIADTWISLDNKIKEVAQDLEKGKYQYILSSTPTLEAPLLVGTFLRRDWKRKEWLQRVVTIRPPLLLIHAHPDDPNEKVESSFRINTLRCELFENSTNPRTIEARRQHSNGLHLEVISDQPQSSANIVLLASSSSSIPRIWVQALNELKKIENDNDTNGDDNPYSSNVKADISPKSPLSFLKYARNGVKKYSIEHTDIDASTVNDIPDVCRSPVHFSERQFTNESDKNEYLHVPQLSLTETIDSSSKNTTSIRSGKDYDPYSLNRKWSLTTKSLNRNKQKSKLFEHESSVVDNFDFSQIPQFVYEGSENDADDYDKDHSSIHTVI
ncbi:conserved Plasmodium protein, unknown function [Babesia microti strain RI]|uniref:PH domain-containing protein n=1 Tax=Babesia microti (strain RI) TaxID=1133968 RepID=A0A0K3ATZ4_BABMR|nr:conserved Plasmodium protein, unknown function [Babesia microti strain RI]CTQ41036.1 conserved Plasmodium protein, unknown function [Babesia microti strain RI]|eukprot:XP_012649047.1 conserved Plasmodium protein, unknown function [Babesia microti strain RI]